MKTKYPRYGKRAKELEQTLTASDRELLDTFLTYCAMTAGKGQVEKHRRNLMYLRDVVEKPLDAISREDAVAFWGIAKACSLRRTHENRSAKKCQAILEVALQRH